MLENLAELAAAIVLMHFIEAILYKIECFFVQVVELKEICDVFEQEYKEISMGSDSSNMGLWFEFADNFFLSSINPFFLGKYFFS